MSRVHAPVMLILQAGAGNSPREPRKGTGGKDSKSWQRNVGYLQVNEAQSEELSWRNCTYNAQRKYFIRMNLSLHPVPQGCLKPDPNCAISMEMQVLASPSWCFFWCALQEIPQFPLWAFESHLLHKAEASISSPKMHVYFSLFNRLDWKRIRNPKFNS